MKTAAFKVLSFAGITAAALALGVPAVADDWPTFGRDASRNAVSSEKNPPLRWQPELKDKEGNVTQPAKGFKWSVQLGSASRAGPVIADGLVWVGTNNAKARDEKIKGDAAVLMCFRESDGKFLYQFISPRLKTDVWNDWPFSSMAAPLVEKDRLWLVTNRCETVCLDIGPLRRGEGEPKLLWQVDMVKDLGVYPRSSPMGEMVYCCIGASHKDLIYITTANGNDPTNKKVPAPNAPSLVCFNKHTGKVVWQDNSPGKNILLGQYSHPVLFEVNGQAQVAVGQGDCWLRSFAAETGKLSWQCDLNPKAAK
jgi:outer membrane protein assembly factor BamB